MRGLLPEAVLANGIVLAVGVAAVPDTQRAMNAAGYMSQVYAREVPRSPHQPQSQMALIARAAATRSQAQSISQLWPFNRFRSNTNAHPEIAEPRTEQSPQRQDPVVLQGPRTNAEFTAFRNDPQLHPQTQQSPGSANMLAERVQSLPSKLRPAAQWLPFPAVAPATIAATVPQAMAKALRGDQPALQNSYEALPADVDEQFGNTALLPQFQQPQEAMPTDQNLPPMQYQPYQSSQQVQQQQSHGLNDQALKDAEDTLRRALERSEAARRDPNLLPPALQSVVVNASDLKGIRTRDSARYEDPGFRQNDQMRQGIVALKGVIRDLLVSRPLGGHMQSTDQNLKMLSGAPNTLLAGLQQVEHTMRKGARAEDVAKQLDMLAEQSRQLTMRAQQLEVEEQSYEKLYKGLNDALTTLRGSLLQTSGL